MSWAFDFALNTTAGPLPVTEGVFTFDRGWAPQGQGTFTVPLAAWEATGLDPLERHKMYVRSAATNFASSTTLAATLPAGSLGSASWPSAPAIPFGSEAPSASTVAWVVYLRSVTVNRADATASLEVATVELAMQETINNYGSWTPQPLDDGSYDAADVLVELLKFLNLQVPVQVLASAVIPAEEMMPWEFGQSAWDYWDRIRVLGELSYGYNPQTGILTLASPVSATGTIPAEWLEHEEEYGSATEESATYADSLAVNWRWTTDNGETEWHQRDVAYAGPEGSWRSARRHQEIDRLGPPVPGYAWRAVAQMARFKVLHVVTVPLTPLLLASAPSVQYQAMQFDFSEQPSATLTILTS